MIGYKTSMFFIRIVVGAGSRQEDFLLTPLSMRFSSYNSMGLKHESFALTELSFLLVYTSPDFAPLRYFTIHYHFSNVSDFFNIKV